uniref:Uncharacterized protein n=1 Tax=Salix viminalis TaxID=40686 RepID=A0A6N2KMS6_SALVM
MGTVDDNRVFKGRDMAGKGGGFIQVCQFGFIQDCRISICF